MKAAVFVNLDEKIKVLEDIPKPVLEKDEVLIKVKYCGICGSDLSNYLYQLYSTPLIMGHEFSGIVDEVGAEVSDFKKGDSVTAYSSLKAFKSMKTFGIYLEGAFAEYIKVLSTEVIHFNSNKVSFKEACLGEPVACAIHAMNKSNVEQNEGIIILGSGIIGLSLLQVLMATKNPKYVVMIDFNQGLLDLAKELGATACFKPNQKVKIKGFLKRNGRNSFIYDCAGSESSYLLSIELIKHGGTVLLEGIKKGNIPFPLSMVIINELNLIGSYGQTKEEFIKALEFIGDKKINSNMMISEIFPLKDINQAFDKMASKDRKSVKFLVQIS